MKNLKLICILLSLLTSTTGAFAQVGIGTTTPNSTLDVRGSMALTYRSFTTNTTLTVSDNTLAFTGTAAATLTLPDATACIGRAYWIKNASSNTSLLTIVTTSSQTIDGATTWLLDETNETVRVASNGANWLITDQSLPSGSYWSLSGNTVGTTKNLGTIDNNDLPFITNNTEKMRLSASGNLGIGTNTFNATYPEKLVVNAGTTTSVNAIVGKGTINNYLQLNIQNYSNGTSASSDVVATADNGTEITNYVDMGINGSGNTSGIMGGANDAYLYNIGQNFLIGTGTAAKSLVFMTGGTTQASNERMRIDGSGNVGIATTAPTAKLDVSGTYKLGTAGTVLTNMIKTSFSITDAVNFDFTGTRQITVTVTGAIANATVIINPRTALPTGIGIGWSRVSSTNNVTIGFTNTDTSPRSLGTVTFDVTIIQ